MGYSRFCHLISLQSHICSPPKFSVHGSSRQLFEWLLLFLQGPFPPRIELCSLRSLHLKALTNFLVTCRSHCCTLAVNRFSRAGSVCSSPWLTLVSSSFPLVVPLTEVYVISWKIAHGVVFSLRVTIQTVLHLSNSM